MSRLTIQEALKKITNMQDNMDKGYRTALIHNAPKDPNYELEIEALGMVAFELQRYKDLEEQGRLVELPCKVGDVLYKIVQPYRQPLKITKYRVKNFRTIKKGQKLQIEVQADSSPCKSWANFENFYTTKEEAEAKLAELKGTEE